MINIFDDPKQKQASWGDVNPLNFWVPPHARTQHMHQLRDAAAPRHLAWLAGLRLCGDGCGRSALPARAWLHRAERVGAERT